MSTQSKIYSLSFLYKIKITDEEIVGVYDLRSHRLAWNEITSVRPNLKGQGLILSNAGEDTSIYINPNVRGYSEIVELIQKRRPDLWKKEDSLTFHYSPLKSVLAGSGGITLMFYIFILEHSNPNLFVSLIGIVIGLFLIGFAIRCRTKLFFDRDMIVIKYMFGERKISARDIKTILTELPLIVRINNKPVFSIVLKNTISLQLQNGKVFSIGNVKEDGSIFLSSLQKWTKNHAPTLS